MYAMKSVLLLILVFQTVQARADLPYMPLRFTLSTRQASYEEGDRIDFVLTITNTDPQRSYPVLTPGDANSGKKLVYLRVFDPAQNLYVERAMESRDITMDIKDLGIPEKIRLAPGAELTIPFYWNDMNQALHKTEGHHSFGKPLFAGRYFFQAFYDPSGTGVGDSLYHFINSTEEEQSADKLNFMGPAMSQPCLVTITPRPSGIMDIEGITYIRTDTPRAGYYQYYIGSKADSNQVHISVFYGEEKTPRLEVRRRRYKNLEWIARYENGNIQKHNLSREHGCPEVYYDREFQYKDEKKPAQVTDMDASGTVRTRRYYEDGRLMNEQVYQMPGQIYNYVEYVYKGHKLVRKKRQSGKFKIPCEDMVEIINHE